MARFVRKDTYEGLGSHGAPRIGVVGLGYWGPNLLRVIAEMEGASVTHICDTDADRLARFTRRYPAVRASRDFQDLLDDPEVDAIVIATPVFTHFDLAARSLAAGKHTLVEKPLAPSSQQADELMAMAEARGLVLMCGHTFLYSPPVRAVKEMIDRGDLGDIYFISSSRVNLGLHQRDVSVIWDLGPHDFSILRYWLGETPDHVSAMGRDSILPGVPDVAFINLNFPSGVLASVELSWLAPSKLRRTVVVGSEKMVVYEDGSPEPVRIFDHGVVFNDPETFGQYQLSYRTGDILSVKLPSYEPLHAELMHFVGCVRTGASLDDMTAIGRNVVRLCEAADASLRSGGEEVKLATVGVSGGGAADGEDGESVQ
jgi:predicted dehydrogenase